MCVFSLLDFPHRNISEKFILSKPIILNSCAYTLLLVLVCLILLFIIFQLSFLSKSYMLHEDNLEKRVKGKVYSDKLVYFHLLPSNGKKGIRPALHPFHYITIQFLD